PGNRRRRLPDIGFQEGRSRSDLIFNTKIGTTDLRISHDRMRLAVSDFAAELQHYETRDDREKSMHDVFNPHDSNALLIDLFDELDQLVTLSFRKAARDLIKENDLGF